MSRCPKCDLRDPTLCHRNSPDCPMRRRRSDDEVSRQQSPDLLDTAINIGIGVAINSIFSSDDSSSSSSSSGSFSGGGGDFGGGGSSGDY